MDMSQFPNIGRNILLLIGQIIVLLVCITFIQFIYYNDILPDKVVAETYGQTDCTIVSAQITKHGRMMHRYRADFLVSYNADGRSYNTLVSANGLNRSFTTDRVSQETALSGYEVGQSYPCWYNPVAPQLAVLVLRSHWASTFPLFVPSLILLITIYFFSRTFFEIMGVVFHVINERKANKK